VIGVQICMQQAADERRLGVHKSRSSWLGRAARPNVAQVQEQEEVIGGLDTCEVGVECA
jgi:hypothetical protein